jgi:hypothetical protein
MAFETALYEGNANGLTAAPPSTFTMFFENVIAAHLIITLPTVQISCFNNQSQPSP